MLGSHAPCRYPQAGPDDNGRLTALLLMLFLGAHGCLSSTCRLHKASDLCTCKRHHNQCCSFRPSAKYQHISLLSRALRKYRPQCCPCCKKVSGKPLSWEAYEATDGRHPIFHTLPGARGTAFFGWQVWVGEGSTANPCITDPHKLLDLPLWSIIKSNHPRPPNFQ